jgi:lipopolysaccharide/colanic/teichoic acid biosynthesis glycosyltransferase
MSFGRKREYGILLLGDLGVFALSLYGALALRHLEYPSWDVYQVHLTPFALLFGLWIVVFFIAGLYDRHTRIFRSGISSRIIFAQSVNVGFAALFFFLFSAFGIAPKTVLAVYLVVSSLLIYVWRALLFAHLPALLAGRKAQGILVASGSDARLLAEEIARDERFPFVFTHVIDTEKTPIHEVIREACRLASVEETTFLAIDLSDKSLEQAHPIIYDAAFRKKKFAIVDIVELYQEVFDRVPLSLVKYEWILASATPSSIYAFAKRALDISIACIVGLLTLPLYPFVALAITLEDKGPVFITQTRIGRFGNPIRIVKFRSMSGNDEGKYGEGGKTQLVVTRVGAFLRKTRIDELPQVWMVLKGDLSLVGPRPELPSIAREYSAKIPYYDARTLIPPGLTGWAQIRHDTHPHHGTDITETRMKLAYDLHYLRKSSILLDLYIMIQTARIVLTARGT